MKKLLLILVCVSFFYSCKRNKNQIKKTKPNTISTSSIDFIPKEFICNLGDTIYFDLGPTHNLIEVSKENFLDNNPEPINNGFEMGFGKTSFFVPEKAKTYYFVCPIHLPQMKLKINVNP